MLWLQWTDGISFRQRAKQALDALREAEGGDEKVFGKMLMESHIVNEWRGQYPDENSALTLTHKALVGQKTEGEI